eukprot:127113-Chlamydomonas_euryale.AAC.4
MDTSQLPQSLSANAMTDQPVKSACKLTNQTASQPITHQSSTPTFTRIDLILAASPTTGKTTDQPTDQPP